VGHVIAIALLVGLGWLGWSLTQDSGDGGMAGPGGPGGPPGRGGYASTVAIATAKTADMPVWLDSLGTVTPTATVTVTPQVGGVITQVLFDEGQMVRKGALLATIDARAYDAALMQARGTLKRDQAQLEAAKQLLSRYRALLKQDSIAGQDVDTQAALVQQLEGTVQSDRASVATAELDVTYTRITAPVAGRIGLRSVDAGNLVSSGTSLAVITSVAPIDVAFTVPQDQVQALLARAATGTLEAQALDRTRSRVLGTGSFRTLDNLVDTDTGTVKAKARFANADNALFPNQFVNVRLALDTLKGVVTVPVEAVRNGSDGDYVYVMGSDKTVQRRAIKAGLSTITDVVITDGLQAGEQVVTQGADRLRDGAKVQLAEDVAAERAATAASRPAQSDRRGPPPGGRPGAGASGVPPRDAALPGGPAASTPIGGASAPFPGPPRNASAPR